MPTLLSEARPKARKAHPCDACVWIENGPNPADCLTVEEMSAWNRAKANGMKILPGETYVRQTINDGGEIRTFKAIPAIHEIALKYDYYQE